MINLTDHPFEKFARGSYYLILENLANLVIGAVFWILLAKLVDPTSLGQAMVVIAFATSVIGFAGYGARVTISKYMAEYYARGMPNNSRRALSLGIKLALAVSAVVALSITLLSGYIADVGYQDPSLAPLLTFAILTFLPSQTIVSALMGAFQGAHRMNYCLYADLIFQVVRIVIAVALVLYGLGTFGILVAFSIASLAVSILGYTYFIPKTIPRLTKQQEGKEGIGPMIKFSGLNYFSKGISTVSSQVGVMTLGMQSFEWAALFGLSVLISNIIGTILLAVSRAMLPTASEEWVKGNKTEFKHMFNAAMRISLLISGFGFLVLMIEPSYVLGLISESYLDASLALRILVIATVLNSVGLLMVAVLNAANRASDVAMIGLLSSLVTITLTIILGTFAGLEGAALAMLVGSIFGLVQSLVILKRREQLVPSKNSVIKPCIALLTALLIAYLSLIVLNNVVIAIVMSLASYAVFSMIYRVTTRTELKTLLTIVLSATR